MGPRGGDNRLFPRYLYEFRYAFHKQRFPSESYNFSMQGHRQKGVYHPVSESKGAHLEKVRAIYSSFAFQLAGI